MGLIAQEGMLFPDLADPFNHSRHGTFSGTLQVILMSWNHVYISAWVQDDEPNAADVYEVDAIISMTVHEEAKRGTEGAHFTTFPLPMQSCI